MVRLLCLFVAVSGFVARAQAQGLPESRPAPKITCGKPTFDIGSVCCGDELEWAWTIRNEGTAGLKIEKVQASWGHAEAKEQVLASGVTTTVHMVSSVPPRPGTFERRAFVTSNDPASPTLVLRR